MNSFKLDSNNEEILLSVKGKQVMMEWEKPYMEESIDLLVPTGDVLEVGFGCGYSATQILKHCPKSYTVIECDPIVIKRAKEWRKQFPNASITIIEGTWQNKLHTLENFDQIYFDDFPLNLDANSSKLEQEISSKRHLLFIDRCIQNHTTVGSRICWYLNGNPDTFDLGSDTEPFIDKYIQTIDVKVPDTCRYRGGAMAEQRCTIPLIVKTIEYDYTVAQRYALSQII